MALVSESDWKTGVGTFWVSDERILYFVFGLQNYQEAYLEILPRRLA